MQKNTTVSVIIPAYNAESHISDCIESILSQTHPALEIIVIDDGSTDDTARIAGGFGEPVRLIRQPNSGVSAARNNGVNSAGGGFIAFIDADDLWMPEKLERQVAYMTRNENVAAVASGFRMFGPGIRTADCLVSDQAFLRHQAISFLAFPVIFSSTLLVRASVAKRVSFPLDVRDGEDLIYEAQVRTYGLIGAIDEPLAYRRQHPGQVTKTAYHFARSFGARLAWAKNNYKEIGVESWAAAESIMCAGAVKNVMASYWTRDLRRFRSWRRELLQNWPPGIPVSDELTRFVPPLIVLKLRDSFGSLSGRKQPSVQFRGA